MKTEISLLKKIIPLYLLFSRISGIRPIKYPVQPNYYVAMQGQGLIVAGLGRGLDSF